MKMNRLAMPMGVAVLGLGSVAQAGLSATIGATSNYLWPGVTQTNDKAVISGGIDYDAESGVYAGFGDFSMSASLAEEGSGDNDPIVFVSWAKSL